MTWPRRWLVAGARGMLGREFTEILEAAGERVTALGRHGLDILDGSAVSAEVEGHDVVVNCAGWTDVDGAESREAEAREVNVTGAAHVATAAASHGARVVHISTDYVFDGTATSPYAEDALTTPRSAYGRTKAEGEMAVRAAAPEHHLILRTAWLYGAYGACFPRTIVRLAREQGAVSVVADQVGQPTWARDLAQTILRLVRAEAPAGTYHATSSGQCSWFEFARAVVESAGLDPGIVSPTASTALVRPAPRPAFSVLGHEALRAAGIAPIGHWHERWREAAPVVLDL